MLKQLISYFRQRFHLKSAFERPLLLFSTKQTLRSSSSDCGPKITGPTFRVRLGFSTLRTPIRTFTVAKFISYFSAVLTSNDASVRCKLMRRSPWICRRTSLVLKSFNYNAFKRHRGHFLHISQCKRDVIIYYPNNAKLTTRARILRKRNTKYVKLQATLRPIRLRCDSETRSWHPIH